MKKNLLLSMTLLLVMPMFFALQSVNAQVLNTESFDATQFLPAGWSAPGPFNFWSRQINGNQPTCTPHSGAAMARFTRNAPPNTNQTICSPLIDLSNVGSDTARVSLWIFRDNGAPTVFDYVGIYVNTQPNLSGASYLGAIARSRLINTPDTQSVNDWYKYTFDIPATFNTNTNYVLIKGANAVQMGNNIFIDDVEWTSFPLPCTGSPAPGIINPSTTLICGGGGAANLSLSGQSTDAGVTFQWQSAPSPTGPWTNFGSGLTTVNTGILFSTTYFQCLVTCTNSALTDSTPFVQIDVSPNFPPNVATTPTNAAYCQGGNPTLIVASGATNYSWAPSAGLNVTIGDSVYASPVNPTQYTVVGTDSSGCADTAIVNVNAMPALNVNTNSNPQNPCAGEPVNLQASIGGPGFGSTYTWNPGNINGNNITVNPLQTTTYTVTVVAFNGGCTASDSITVNVTPGPTADFTYTANGGTVTFQNNSVNASSYYWQFGDGNLSLQANPVYTYSASGTYNVMLIASSGNCAPDTFYLSVTVVVNGINSIDGSNIVSVSPNPFSDFITLNFTSATDEVRFEVFNQVGSCVMKQNFDASINQLQTIKIDLSALPSGIYTLRLNVSGKMLSGKLVKL